MAVLVTEEEEEDTVEEDLDMATRVGAMEVVMTTMEEVTYWLERVKCFSCCLRVGRCMGGVSKLNFPNKKPKSSSYAVGIIVQSCFIKMYNNEIIPCMF